MYIFCSGYIANFFEELTTDILYITIEGDAVTNCLTTSNLQIGRVL